MVPMSKLAIAAMMVVDSKCDELGWAYAEHHENCKHEILMFGPISDDPEITVVADSRCEAWERMSERIIGIEGEKYNVAI